MADKKYVAPHPHLDEHPGMVEPGNINIIDRKMLSVPNPRGGNSSVFSMGSNFGDGVETVIPRVIPDGKTRWKIGTPAEA